MGKRVSRRHLLKLAAAGSAATLPAVAMAAPDRISSDVVQPTAVSLEHELNQCIGELKSILRKMNPDCPIVSGQIMTDLDGGQWVTVSVKPSCFTGDGYYEIRKADGSCTVSHVRQYPEGVRGDLYAAPFIDGYTRGPRVIVTERDLVRRVEA